MARTGIRSSAIIFKNNQILLIHRKKDGDEYWTFPGGGVEEGETWENTVIREVKEETSLEVLNCELAFMNKTYEGGNEHPFYLCEVKEGEAVLGGEEKEKNSEDNFYKLEWIDLSNLKSFNLLPENAKEEVIKKYSK